MMIQKKRFLSFKEMKKIEGEEGLYEDIYEVVTDLKFADLFRSFKYKIGLIYALAFDDDYIERLASSYPNKQELFDLVKADRFLKEDDSIQINFWAEGKKIREFLLEVLEPFVQFLLLLPDTIAFYYRVYERMNDELWGSFGMTQRFVDGICGLENPYYLPHRLIKTIFERKVFITEDSKWKEKLYPLVKYLFLDGGKREFSFDIHRLHNLLKDTVTEILSGDEPEYIHRKIRFVSKSDSSNHDGSLKE